MPEARVTSEATSSQRGGAGNVLRGCCDAAEVACPETALRGTESRPGRAGRGGSRGSGTGETTAPRVGPGPRVRKLQGAQGGGGPSRYWNSEKGKIEGQEGEVQRHHARRKAPRGLGETTSHRRTPGQTSELGMCVPMSPAWRWWSDLRIRGPRMVTVRVAVIITCVVHFLGPMIGLRVGELLQTPDRSTSWGILTRGVAAILFTNTVSA